MRFRVEHEKRNFISASNHVIFFYHVNKIALFRREKLTLSMNENKRIGNPRIEIVKYVGVLEMKARVESLQKETMDLILHLQNYQSLNWSLPTK